MWGEGFQELLERTHGQTKGGGRRQGRWGWLEVEGSGGGKCRQLYLNNNKIIF